MKAIDNAMRALRTIARFEVASAGADVAQAAAHSAREQRQHDASAQHCESIASELRRTMHRSKSIDPAHLNAMQRLFLSQHELLEQGRTRLSSASQHEQRLRETLGALRNRETALDRIIERHRQQAQRQRQDLQMSLLDDLWLQQLHRRSR